MKRRGGSWLGEGVNLLAFTCVLGCDAQVDHEYKGEPLLSLQGNVLVSKGQLGVENVPYLGLLDSDERGTFLALVDGEVSGEFPAKFRFDVTQPPPEEMLHQMPPEQGFSGRGASGLLVMLPPDSDERYRLIPEVETNPGECTDDGTACTSTERICDESGQCRDRFQSCAIDPCELVERVGDPVLDGANPSRTTYRCDSTTCYSTVIVCDGEELYCSMDVYRCDRPQSDNFKDAFDGVVRTCSVVSDTGDTSLRSFFDLNAVAINYAILYVADDNPDTVYGPLERGYHLLQTSDSLDGWLESEKCEFAAREAAVAEYNLENGTDYLQIDSDVEALDLDLAALERCRSTRVIRHPLDVVLTIELDKLQPF